MEIENWQVRALEEFRSKAIKFDVPMFNRCQDCECYSVMLVWAGLSLTQRCEGCSRYRGNAKYEDHGFKPDSTKWTKEERLLNAEYQGGQMTEHQLQAHCFTWHWNNRPDERGLLYMNHNNPRDARHGASLKVMGLVAGVADMTYIHPDGSGITFLEFKAERGKQSASQVWWQSTVESANCKYKIIKSFEDFTESLV